MTIREIFKSLFTSTEVQSLAKKIENAVKPLAATNPAIATLAEHVKKARRELEKARKNSNYNTQTEQVVEADEARDMAFRAFWFYVKAAALRQNERFSKDAQQLQKHLDKFDSRIPNLGYAAQTAEVTLLFREMDKASAYVEGCGATEWLDELKATQAAFEVTRARQMDEEVEKNLLAPARQAKAKAVQQLIALTNTLNGLELAGVEGVAAVNRKVEQIIEEIEIPARARQSRRRGSRDDDESSLTE